MKTTSLKVNLTLPGTPKDIMDNEGIMDWLGDLYLKCKFQGIELVATLDDQPIEISLLGMFPTRPGERPS